MDIKPLRALCVNVVSKYQAVAPDTSRIKIFVPHHVSEADFLASATTCPFCALFSESRHEVIGADEEAFEQYVTITVMRLYEMEIEISVHWGGKWRDFHERNMRLLVQGWCRMCCREIGACDIG